MPFVVYSIIDNTVCVVDLAHISNELSHKFNMNFEFAEYKNLSALVSFVKKKDTGTTRDEVLCYASIIDAMAAMCPVLPMRFGSVLDSYNDVLEYLSRNADAFIRSLALISNKDEYSVKVLFSQSYHEDPVGNTSCNDPQPLPDILNGTNLAREYLSNKYKDYLSDKKKHQYTEQVKSYFMSQALAITDYIDFNKSLSPAFIIDAVLLIDKSKKSKLLDIVVNLRAMFPMHNVMLTGPWPAYNFTKTKI